MLGVLTGGRTCAAVFSSFLLVTVGTHRTGANFCCFLGPGGWLSALSPAAPPRSVLPCMRHSSWARLPGTLAFPVGNNPEIQRSLNY